MARRSRSIGQNVATVRAIALRNPKSQVPRNSKDSTINFGLAARQALLEFDHWSFPGISALGVLHLSLGAAWDLVVGLACLPLRKCECAAGFI